MGNVSRNAARKRAKKTGARQRPAIHEHEQMAGMHVFGAIGYNYPQEGSPAEEAAESPGAEAAEPAGA